MMAKTTTRSRTATIRFSPANLAAAEKVAALTGRTVSSLAELHECCQMPMEQARELAASEASPAPGAMLNEWYARGQDWALADAMSGSLPNDWTAGDIARAYAAGARAGEGVLTAEVTRLVDKCNSYIVDNARLARQVESLRAALDQKQAEYEDLQRHGNNTAHNLARMQSALEQTGTRSADYLRKAIKAEACADEMRAALRRLWPLIEIGMKGYVFTTDKAGEVAADMAALRKCLGA
jgi:hypothetical protein